MAIPTSGAQPAQTYTGTSTYSPTMTIIGDSENLIGYNVDSETDTLNRAPKTAFDNTQFLYNEKTRSDLSLTTSGLFGIKSYLFNLEGQEINHTVTLTAGVNETINGSPIRIRNYYGRGEIILNLSTFTYTFSGAFTDKNAILIENCHVPITINAGIFDDVATDLIEDMIKVVGCTAKVSIVGTTSKYDVAALTADGHFVFDDCNNGYVSSCTIEYGGVGLEVFENSRVLSITNSSSTKDPQVGLRAILGGVIAKSGTQFGGDSAAEETSDGGVIR